MISLKILKKFGLEAIMGFILWTLTLTPYMMFVVRTSIEQYLAWILMQIVLVPPISILVVGVTNWVVKRVLK